ncbi:50S ribosomal protein L3 N(5)-glutamine methyltransferase [Pseudoalteromonas sp. B193]
MSDLQIEEATLEEAVAELSTLHDWLRWTTSQFASSSIFFGHGTDNAWDEAVSLLLLALSLPVDAPKELMHARLTSTEKTDFAGLIAERINDCTPVPYLTNIAWFAGMPFYVDERVLIPRSPFAELISNRFTPWLEEPQSVNRILDLCTGSGCIAIALAQAFEQAQVDAVVYRMKRLKSQTLTLTISMLSDRVLPIQSDVFSGVPGQKYDLIVANPPYVDAEDMADLPREFHHEPELGLASGHDGLDVTRTILSEASEHLTDNGLLFVEVGNSMVHMDALYPGAPFEWIEFEQGGLGICN